jgi:hypothetical protein
MIITALDHYHTGFPCISAAESIEWIDTGHLRGEERGRRSDLYDRANDLEIIRIPLSRSRQ